MEKGMAIYFSILAWRFPWTEEPGGLQSMRSQRVGQKRTTKLPTEEEMPTEMIEKEELNTLEEN